jgi:SNF2 family DNA or RNA helicase
LVGRGASGFPSFFSFKKHYAISKLFVTVRMPGGRVRSMEATDANLAQISAQELHVLNRHTRDIAFKNHHDLHAITQRHAYTVRKSEVLTELPPKTYQRREIELSPEQKKIYTELAENCSTTIGARAFSFTRSTPYMKLHQVANGYVLDENGEAVFLTAQPKLGELEQILAELGDEKLVIWSPFLAQIAQIQRFLAANDVKTVCLSGETPVNKRGEIIHNFQDPQGVQVFIANPAVGGLGLNLTCAHTELFFTNWFQPDIRSQAEDRLHRIGQQNPVTVIDFVAKGTLEVALLRNTRQKIDTENAILSMGILFGEEK